MPHERGASGPRLTDPCSMLIRDHSSPASDQNRSLHAQLETHPIPEQHDGMQGITLLICEVSVLPHLGQPLLPGLVHDDCSCNLPAARSPSAR